MAMDLVEPLVERHFIHHALELLHHEVGQGATAPSRALPEGAVQAFGDIPYLQHLRHAVRMRSMASTCKPEGPLRPT